MNKHFPNVCYLPDGSPSGVSLSDDRIAVSLPMALSNADDSHAYVSLRRLIDTAKNFGRKGHLTEFRICHAKYAIAAVKGRYMYILENTKSDSAIGDKYVDEKYAHLTELGTQPINNIFEFQDAIDAVFVEANVEQDYEKIVRKDLKTSAEGLSKLFFEARGYDHKPEKLSGYVEYHGEEILKTFDAILRSLETGARLLDCMPDCQQILLRAIEFVKVIVGEAPDQQADQNTNEWAPIYPLVDCLLLIAMKDDFNREHGKTTLEGAKKVAQAVRKIDKSSSVDAPYSYIMERDLLDRPEVPEEMDDPEGYKVFNDIDSKNTDAVCINDVTSPGANLLTLLGVMMEAGYGMDHCDKWPLSHATRFAAKEFDAWAAAQ